MFCHQCGHAIPVGANFCSSCGAPANANVFTASPIHTIYRPRGLRVVGGVCAAFALRYRWDLTAIRILTVIIGIFLFPLGEIAYLTAWLLIPEEVPFVVTPPPVPNVPPQSVQPR